MLAEAEEIGVETREAALVRRLEQRAFAWQQRARALLEEGGESSSEEEGEEEDGKSEAKAKSARGHAGGAADARSSSGGSSGGGLSPANAEAFLTEGESCEVEPEALSHIRKLALRLATWHKSVLSVLNGEHSIEWTVEEAAAAAAIEATVAPLVGGTAAPPPPAAPPLAAVKTEDESGEAVAVKAEAAPAVDKPREGKAAAGGVSSSQEPPPPAASPASGSNLAVSHLANSPHLSPRAGSKPSPKESPRLTGTLPPGVELSAGAKRKALSPAALLLTDVPYLSRDHLRSVIKKEGVSCKASGIPHMPRSHVYRAKISCEQCRERSHQAPRSCDCRCVRRPRSRCRCRCASSSLPPREAAVARARMAMAPRRTTAVSRPWSWTKPTR